MRQEKILCIGGPLDGEWVIDKCNFDTFRVNSIIDPEKKDKKYSIGKSLEPCGDDKSLYVKDLYLTIEESIYKKKLLSSNNGNRYYVFVYEKEVKDIIRELLEGYVGVV